MKIEGSNPYINLYKKIQQNNKSIHQPEHKDRINISNEAKQMQENNQAEQKRVAYVNEIKQSVQTGEYKINHEKLAEKMIDFWGRHK